MRDTIAWSHALLTEQEQRLFRRLSVFAGSFSQQGAEAVCNEAGDTAVEPDHPEAIEVLEGMRSLVGKSLIRRVMQEEGGDPRLSMLETVREYAWEQLAASGETEVLRRRHADFYVRLAELVSPNPATKEGLDGLNRLRPEQDNFRAALNWLLQQKHSETAEVALRLLQALQFFWERHTQHVELIAWLKEALAQAGPEATPLKVWALRRGAIQADRRADYELAGVWVEQALRMARKLGDKSEVIECINLQSRVALGLGDYASARSMMEEVLATSREIGNDFMVAATLINLVGVAQHQGDYEGAERLSREGLENFTKLGNRIGIMWALLNLGDTLRYLGRLDEARTELLKALALAQEADHPLAADTLVVLASVTMAEVNQAQENFAGNQGQILHAVRLLALAARILERRGSRLEGALQTASEQSLAIARDKLGGEAFNRAWEEGWSLGLDQALELASRDYRQEGESKPRGRGRPKKRVAGGLTDREYDVAALLARGMTNAQIARQLVLSVRTVEAHVANAMQKLGLHTRTEFAAWAMREGIVPHPAQE
jgi:non-specific serine/threonine protein kinase